MWLELQRVAAHNPGLTTARPQVPLPAMLGALEGDDPSDTLPTNCGFWMTPERSTSMPMLARDAHWPSVSHQTQSSLAAQTLHPCRELHGVGQARCAVVGASTCSHQRSMAEDGVPPGEPSLGVQRPSTPLSGAR